MDADRGSGASGKGEDELARRRPAAQQVVASSQLEVLIVKARRDHTGDERPVLGRARIAVGACAGGDRVGGGRVGDDPRRLPRQRRHERLGTTFTLACPFTLLAHYGELDWAESCGVSRYLIRISVGLEEVADLW